MKLNFDPRHVRISIHVVLTVAVCLIIYKIVFSIGGIFEGFTKAFSRTWGIMNPFIIAFGIAYFLNPAVMFIEKKLSLLPKGNKLKPKAKRSISILVNYLFFIGILVLVVVLMIPTIASNVNELIDDFPDMIEDAKDFINDGITSISLIDEYNVVEKLVEYFEGLIERSGDIVMNVANGFLRFAISFGRIIMNTVIALFIAVYILFDKERFIRQFKKLIMAFTRRKHGDYIINMGREVNNIFSRYILGRVLDSLIIGIICFIGLSFMKVEFALLISVIVGITNVIPYFGPFIGAIPSGIIVLMTQPHLTFVFGLFILALQQFDGWYLGPLILGHHVGLRPFWIILAIVVGGGLFGVMGMFLGVPTVAFVYIWIKRVVDKRLVEKGVDEIQ